MTYWQTTPSTYTDRLEELAQTLSACRDAFHETASEFGWEPAAGSGAAQAATSLPSPDPAIDKPTAETGHRLITEAIQIFLFNSAAHLGSWAALLRAAEVVATPPLLLRAVIENCAHAVWVTGDDPTEAPEERLARAYLEELKSAEEAKMNSGRLSGKSDPTYTRTANAYKKVKADIAARFPDSTPEELGKYRLHGQALPGLEASVKWMYELTARFGGNIDATIASGLYGLLSNLTHPTLYTVREMRVWTKDEKKGDHVANVSVTIESVEKDVRAALAAFYNAMTYVTSYYGWPETALRTLESKIEAVIPDFFNAPLEVGPELVEAAEPEAK
ncbi:hypothetical protein [Pseudarthrobacter polychromogenes]|uniref:Uncharacterized protein n=1 Tax=Pseudarthrobacter polychromogenes TaxID=1676 RepID=A0ABQ1XXR1_9MICC|nr:hypothetical protein [Pseudarthrobacter polychromogenes]GGH05987.1 hypothetical protein GCM10011577_32910 [Pseudarthrobacter polychromogenes]